MNWLWSVLRYNSDIYSVFHGSLLSILAKQGFGLIFERCGLVNRAAVLTTAMPSVESQLK
jgi:hypothetical protein